MKDDRIYRFGVYYLYLPLLLRVNDPDGAEPTSPILSFRADCALLLTLLPGAYTLQVAGADGGTEIALVELYEMP